MFRKSKGLRYTYTIGEQKNVFARDLKQKKNWRKTIHIDWSERNGAELKSSWLNKMSLEGTSIEVYLGRVQVAPIQWIKRSVNVRVVRRFKEWKGGTGTWDGYGLEADRIRWFGSVEGNALYTAHVLATKPYYIHNTLKKAHTNAENSPILHKKKNINTETWALSYV